MGRWLAHTHGPEHTRQKRTIALDELVVPEPPTFVARLRSSHDGLHVPSFLEVQSQVCEATIEQELTCWGHSCSDFCFGEHDTFLIVSAMTL